MEICCRNGCSGIVCEMKPYEVYLSACFKQHAMIGFLIAEEVLLTEFCNRMQGVLVMIFMVIIVLMWVQCIAEPENVK